MFYYTSTTQIVPRLTYTFLGHGNLLIKYSFLHNLMFFWPCIIVLIFSNYQLNAQFLYSSTICMLHYDPQHISSSTLLILRRTNCITTASGIVTLCKQPYTLCRWRADCRGWRYQRLWWYNLSSWGWAACCSKYVEDGSVTYILLKNKGIVH